MTGSWSCCAHALSPYLPKNTATAGLIPAVAICYALNGFRGLN